MESFAIQTKKRLFAKKIKLSCCRRAFFMGMVLPFTAPEEGGGRIVLPFDEAEEPIKKMIREHCGRSAEPVVSQYLKKKNLTFEAQGFVRMLSDAHGATSLDAFLPKMCPQCKAVFLRAVFISSGRMIPPEKGYSLELDCRRATDLVENVATEEEISFHRASRRGREYLYSKKSSIIEDFFTLIGDHELSFALMNEKIERQFRNDANRVASCESNNIARTVSAAGEQIDIIEQLIASEKLSLLPIELQETVLARLEYREASLASLAGMMNPPLTKSGLNHRLQKAMILAKQILEEN